MTPMPFINAKESISLFFYTISKQVEHVGLKIRRRRRNKPRFEEDPTEVLFLHVCGILYTRISMDSLPQYLDLLANSTQSFSPLESFYISIIVISIITTYINTGEQILLSSYLDFFFVITAYGVKHGDVFLLSALISWAARTMESARGFEGGGAFSDKVCALLFCNIYENKKKK